MGAALALAAIGGPSAAQVDRKPPAAAGEAQVDKGRQLFGDYGCGSCHALSDAGATGHVGPALDGNANLTADFIVDRVSNGQGVMPSFSSQLSAEEIAAVAAYVAKVAAK